MQCRCALELAPLEVALLAYGVGQFDAVEKLDELVESQFPAREPDLVAARIELLLPQVACQDFPDTLRTVLVNTE